MKTEEEYTVFKSKSISDIHLLKIIELRKTHYYDSIYDERYWNGGVYNVNDIEVMKGKVDESSKYIMLLDSDDSVIAYARYSTSYEKIDEKIAAKLHIILSNKRIIGKKLKINVGSKVILEKASDFILKSIINDCEQKGSSLLISEICIYPYPNLPSLIFHKNRGFLLHKRPLNTLHSQNGDMVFITLCKGLNNNSIVTI